MRIRARRDRSLGWGRAAACAVRCAARGGRLGRHRPAFSRQRSALEGRRQRLLRHRGARARARRRPRRRQRRSHAARRGAANRAASRGDPARGRPAPRARSRARQPQGHDHRAARVPRARRGARRAGSRAARARRWQWRSQAALAAALAPPRAHGEPVAPAALRTERERFRGRGGPGVRTLGRRARTSS